VSEAVASAAETAESARRETGILMRGYRAFELLFSVHARVAVREASTDLRRILTGIALGLAALALLSFALILGQFAAVLLVEKRFQWGLPASLGAVACGDIAVALVLLLATRARLSTPVLAETRAMMKKAASVLRG
jgi:hypothetical protein